MSESGDKKKRHTGPKLDKDWLAKIQRMLDSKDDSSPPTASSTKGVPFTPPSPRPLGRSPDPVPITSPFAKSREHAPPPGGPAPTISSGPIVMQQLVVHYGQSDEANFQRAYPAPVLMHISQSRENDDDESQFATVAGTDMADMQWSFRERMVHPIYSATGAKEYTVGRKRSCDVVISIAKLSKFHARLFCKDGVWFVEDIGSTNGTYVDKKRLLPGHPEELHNSAELSFGTEAVFQFYTPVHLFRMIKVLARS